MIMNLTEDMKDLLQLFNKHSVKYMIVGGFAVIAYGYVRLTQDIDILLYPSKKNAENIKQSIVEFGFGEAGIPWDYFEKEGTAIHLGVEPNRIDLLTHLKGVDNDTLFNNMQRSDFDGFPIPIISKKDLLKVKLASKRLKDLADAEELSKLDN